MFVSVVSHIKMDYDNIINILCSQLKSNFYFLSEEEINNLKKALPHVFKRIEVCFHHINNKYYSNEYGITFNPFHSGQYLIFLYFLSNTVYKMFNDEVLASKIYYLNKIMNGIDLYYQVEMPDIFFMEHPVGTVIGRAMMKNNLVVYQNCTIGGSYIGTELFYPSIDENVILYSYSCILGKSKIGKNTIISSHCYIINEDIPPNSIVFGNSRNLIIKKNNSQTKFFK